MSSEAGIEMTDQQWHQEEPVLVPDIVGCVVCPTDVHALSARVATLARNIDQAPKTPLFF